MHTVLKRKLFTAPFPLGTQCTLEEHLTTLSSVVWCSPEPKTFPPTLLLQTFKSFLSVIVKLQQKVPAQWAEDMGTMMPWYVLGIRHNENMQSFLDLFHKSIISGWVTTCSGSIRLLLQCSCLQSCTRCEALPCWLVHITGMPQQPPAESLYGKGLPLQQ